MRVVIPHVGGGFGGKAGIHLEPLLACLSRKAGGRPVKLQASREEEFSLLPCRSALTYRIKTGVALRRPHHRPGDARCTGTPAPTPTTPSTSPAPRPTRPAGPYDIPNAWVDAYTIYTNKP